MSGDHQPSVWPGTRTVEQPTLHGDSIALRPWRPDDADEVYRACQDPEIQRWTTVPSPYAREDADSWVGSEAARLWAAGTEAAFAVVSADDGSLLASCTLRIVDGRRGVGEIGYWAAAWARGRGVTAEAVRVVARWGLEDVGFRRIEIVVDPANAASRATALAAGAGEDGIHTDRCRRRDGSLMDALVYVLGE